MNPRRAPWGEAFDRVVRDVGADGTGQVKAMGSGNHPAGVTIGGGPRPIAIQRWASTFTPTRNLLAPSTGGASSP